MKKIIFIFIFTAFLTNYINAQWVLTNDTIWHDVEAFSDNGNYLFAAVPSDGVYKTSNNGLTWSLFNVKINARTANCIAAKNNMVFLATDTGLYKSTNNGNNWFIVDNLIGNYIEAVTVAESFLFIGKYDGIFRSDNWGTNWVMVNNEIQWHYHDVRYFAYSNNNLYVALDSIPYHLRIYKSINFGNNWSLISQDIPSWNIPYSLYASDNLLLCGTSLGIYESLNYGANWSLINGIPVNIGLFGYATSGTKNIFISTWGYGNFYVSNNYGQTWNIKNEGLGGGFSTAVYKFGDYLFLSCGAIFRRPINELVGIRNISSNIPDKYYLYQNYPNPFNPSTNIKFQIKESKFVTLKIFDILGKEISTLVNEKQSPGTYEVSFDGSNLSSGIYFYSLFADGKLIDTKKLMLLK